MMKNKRLEDRRKKISKDIEVSVKQSFDIVDRIHEILVKQGKEQKDLARLLGKSESEISKWMTGTHNFTINTLAKIQVALGEPIIQIVNENRQSMPLTIFVSNAEFALQATNLRTRVSTAMRMSKITPASQLTGHCFN